jgi:hypothetical protein
MTLEAPGSLTSAAKVFSSAVAAVRLKRKSEIKKKPSCPDLIGAIHEKARLRRRVFSRYRAFVDRRVWARR